MTKKELIDILQYSADLIWDKIDNDADRHYSNYIFDRAHSKHDNYFDEYVERYAKDEYENWEKLTNYINELDLDEDE
jgi:hypothetical protein